MDPQNPGESSLPTQATPITEVATPPPPPPTQPVQYERPKRRHWLKVILIFIMLIALLVAGGVAYAMVFSDQVISSAVSEVDSSLRIHTQVRIAPESSNPAINGAFLQIVSDTDRSSGEPKHQSVIKLSSVQFSAEAEIKVIDRVLYGRINNLPANFSREMTPYIGKWHSVSFDVLEKLAAENKVATSSLYNQQTSLGELYEKQKEFGVLEKPQFIGVTERNGEQVRMYSLAINKSALADLIIAMYTEKATESVPAEYIEVAKKSMENTLEQITIDPLIVSVSLFSGKLRHVQANFGFEKMAVGGDILGIGISLSYDEMSPEVTVTAPPDAISLDELVLEAARTPQLRAKDARIKASLAQARTMAEIYYDRGRAYTGMCTQSQDIQALFTDLKEIGVAPRCRASGQVYAISAQLLERPNTYFCVDSTGRAVTLNKQPTSTACR
jgi:hypothetical protein